MLRISILVIFVLSFLIGTAFAQDDSTLVLDELVDEALTNNPQLKSYYSASRADRELIPQAGALPDPMLSLSLMNLPVDNFVFDQEPMTGKQIGVKQVFPFPGKLGLKSRIASRQAEVSLANYSELQLQLRRNVKLLYYDIYYVDRAITTTGKNQSLLKEFVKVAETKYSVGKGLQQDVLKAQVELSKMTDRLINLNQKRTALESKMNTLLNRPVDQPLGKTLEPEIHIYHFDRDSLKGQLESKRPLIEAWRKRIEQSKYKVDLAKKNYWPDFAVTLAYTQRDVLQNGTGGVDFLSGGISLNIPLYFWRKQSRAVQEKVIRSQQVEESYNNIHNQIYAELEDVFSDLNKNADLIDLYRTGIVPQASQSLESAMIGYQTDKVDFLTLVNNQLTLFSLELEYARIVSNYQKNIARLEFITGGDLKTNQ
jgi:outer membrane protein, heavy metal efflux system